MVREDDMVYVARRIARHVASRAIIGVRQARRLPCAAIGYLMASQAFGAKVRGLLICPGHGMGIVAGTAPQLFAARALARALREILGVARHGHQ
jgi:hypothetical protein